MHCTVAGAIVRCLCLCSNHAGCRPSRCILSAWSTRTHANATTVEWAATHLPHAHSITNNHCCQCHCCNGEHKILLGSPLDKCALGRQLDKKTCSHVAVAWSAGAVMDEVMPQYCFCSFIVYYGTACKVMTLLITCAVVITIAAMATNHILLYLYDRC